MVILAALSLIKFLKDRYLGPYGEGRVGYWRRHHFDRTFRATTVGGFKVQVHLRGNIVRVDNQAFNEAQMLSLEAIEEVIEAYRTDAFLPLLSSSTVLAFGWANLLTGGTIASPEFRMEAEVWAHRVSRNDQGELICEFDPNCLETVKAANQLDFQKNGCRIAINLMQVGLWWDTVLIEENAKMAEEQGWHAIEANGNYNKAIEQSAVMAMKALKNLRDRLLVEQVRQTHQSGRLQITTQGLGQTVRIAWTIA